MRGGALPKEKGRRQRGWLNLQEKEENKGGQGLNLQKNGEDTRGGGAYPTGKGRRYEGKGRA